MSISELISMFAKGTLETLYMTLISTFFAYLLGLPLGLALIITDKEGLHPMKWANRILGFVVNFFRSVPFLILLIALMSVTRFIIGTSIGSKAIIPPLVIAAAPFIARLVESSIKEVDKGVIEAATSMGASKVQIIFKVLLTEAKPSLAVGSAIAVTTILGYTAMGGFVGGGGLGNIAIQYGLYRYKDGIMWIAVILLVIVVQILQEIGMRIAKKIDRRLS